MPKVSVIVPAYNYGRYLPEAIRSIQAQDEQDLEILVIDNGSTDDTADVLARLQDPRIRVITLSPNRGLSVAINVGLDAAEGEYIAYLDADDRWLPGKLAKQLRLLESEPDVGVVFCNFYRFTEEGVRPGTQFDFFPEISRIPTVRSQNGEGWRIATDAFAALVEFFDPPAWLQTMVFRRRVVADTRFIPGMRLCQDTEFALRVYRRTHVAFMEEPLVEVRTHERNLTRVYSEMSEAKVVALALVRREPLTPVQRNALERRLGRAHLEWGRVALQNGEVRKGIKTFVRALSFPTARGRALMHLAVLPVHPDLLRGLTTSARTSFRSILSS